MIAKMLIFAASLAAAPPGQIQWTTPGTYEWTVPDGVFEVSGVSIAPGTPGYGGGLHWRNDIPVTPGEKLTVIVGLSSVGSASTETCLKRGSTYLLRSYGRSTYFNTLGGGGGSGGAGAPPGSPIGSRGGGGAGGYMGNGGNGGNDTTNPPVANSGGGYSGSTGDGDGVGLLGRTPDFAPGSLGTPKCGGGIGEGSVGLDGGLRLLWGSGRSYPDNAPNV